MQEGGRGARADGDQQVHAPSQGRAQGARGSGSSAAPPAPPKELHGATAAGVFDVSESSRGEGGGTWHSMSSSGSSEGRWRRMLDPCKQGGHLRGRPAEPTVPSSLPPSAQHGRPSMIDAVWSAYCVRRIVMGALYAAGTPYSTSAPAQQSEHFLPPAALKQLAGCGGPQHRTTAFLLHLCAVAGGTHSTWTAGGPGGRVHRGAGSKACSAYPGDSAHRLHVCSDSPPSAITRHSPGTP